MARIQSNYGDWLECCRERARMGFDEWAFCLDLETSIYKSIITGDLYPDDNWRQTIFKSITKLALTGIR